MSKEQDLWRMEYLCNVLRTSSIKLRAIAYLIEFQKTDPAEPEDEMNDIRWGLAKIFSDLAHNVRTISQNIVEWELERSGTKEKPKTKKA